MQNSETAPTTAEHDHRWQPAGKCRHGFTGATEFEAFVCSVCGLGGHRRKQIFACARTREAPAARAERIAAQVAACPVWDKLSDRAKASLRG